MEQMLRKLSEENGIERSAKVPASIKPTKKTPCDSTEMVFGSSFEGVRAAQLDLIAGALEAFRGK